MSFISVKFQVMFTLFIRIYLRLDPGASLVAMAQQTTQEMERVTRVYGRVTFDLPLLPVVAGGTAFDCCCLFFTSFLL